MTGLSKLGTGLTIVFVVCLLLLIAEVSYVLWSRRRYRRRNATVVSDGSGVTYTANTNNPFTSKELMYFFCWNNQSRVEPASAPTAPSTDQQEPSSESDDPLKWQVLYGQSRLLFTIKEEDREDLESEKSSSADRKPNLDQMRISLSDFFEKTQEVPPPETVSVQVNIDGLTPFSTPCASPPYYTPSPSPTRTVSGEDQAESFVSLQVPGN